MKAGKMTLTGHLRKTRFAYGALTGVDVKILTDGPVLTEALTVHLRRLTGQLGQQRLQNLILHLLTGALT